MHRWMILSVLVLMPAWMAYGAELTKNMPNEHTPPKLVEAWLRFHERDLCLSVDAVFIFDNKGMEAWYVSKDDATDRKMRELFQPSDNSYRAVLYPTRKPEEKRTLDDENGPPPSLYLNDELRGHLLDIPPVFWSSDRYGDTRAAELRKWAVDAQLITFAEQILTWNDKVKRYAMDLPLLVQVASDPSMTSEARSLAGNICKAHAKNMGKIVGKLEKKLKQAMPPGDQKIRSANVEKPGKEEGSPAESAEHISVTARNIARRIYQFIYPVQHIVSIRELRQPSLLESLRSLKNMEQDFQKMPVPPQDK
jgi:hypothetical protein